jgi:hypothetical protein
MSPPQPRGDHRDSTLMDRPRRFYDQRISKAWFAQLRDGEGNPAATAVVSAQVLLNRRNLTKQTKQAATRRALIPAKLSSYSSPSSLSFSLPPPSPLFHHSRCAAFDIGGARHDAARRWPGGRGSRPRWTTEPSAPTCRCIVVKALIASRASGGRPTGRRIWTSRL